MDEDPRVLQTKIYAAEREMEAATMKWTAAQELLRPSIMLKPRLSIDGNQWCALYGENLQDGVAGFGDSPDLAYRDFDMNWNEPLPDA